VLTEWGCASRKRMTIIGQSIEACLDIIVESPLCLLPVSMSPLFLPTAHRLLSTVYCLLFTVYCLLSAVYWLHHNRAQRKRPPAHSEMSEVFLSIARGF
jgi:hypothetical protein